jgi:hypothetical protein
VDDDSQTGARRHHSLTEEQVKQITYESIEASSSSLSSLSSPPPLFLSAFKRRRKNANSCSANVSAGGGGNSKKKGHNRNGRHSDYASALLASMDKYVWKYFYFFGLPCRWSASRYASIHACTHLPHRRHRLRTN